MGLGTIWTDRDLTLFGNDSLKKSTTKKGKTNLSFEGIRTGEKMVDDNVKSKSIKGESTVLSRITGVKDFCNGTREG